MACFVTGSPMIEQLHPRGETEKVFRINVAIAQACYRPTPLRRKLEDGEISSGVLSSFKESPAVLQ